MSSASLRLMGALNITKTIINECKAKGYPPVAVSILSCAGNPVTTVLMDGCSPVIFPQMAESKARVAVGFKVSSRDFGDKYLSTGSPTKIMQLDNMCSISNLAMFPGGVTIKDASGRIVGGVGVSGATGDQDEELALLGSEAYKELE